MADTAPAKSNSMESPCPNTSASQADRQMPTKTYATSTRIATGGSTNSIDSPAPARGYTKK